MASTTSSTVVKTWSTSIEGGKKPVCSSTSTPCSAAKLLSCSSKVGSLMPYERITALSAAAASPEAALNASRSTGSCIARS